MNIDPANHEENLNLLRDSTIEVFNDCLLPNGCLIAAPTHMPYYPKDAKSYLYSWPGRDNGFNLAAMLLLGHDHYEPILKWLWERAEDFGTAAKPQHLGLIYRSYFPNGLVREHQFQPDQGATLIWSIHFKKELTKKPLTDLEEMIVNRIANTFARLWEDEQFTIPTEDIWEERGFMPGEGSFTYSIAACSKAMYLADELLNESAFKRRAEDMKNVLLKHIASSDVKGFPRAYGGSLGTDKTIDGSLSGLVWPFNLDFNKERIQQTIDRIEDEILDQYGVYRYPQDKYEGKASRYHKNEKAGAWPLLTFWLSIAYKELGDEQRAKRYFNLVLKNLEDRYIPEQFFLGREKNWHGIKPLLWSHSMGILAAWKLGFLDQKAQ